MMGDPMMLKVVVTLMLIWVLAEWMINKSRA